MIVKDVFIFLVNVICFEGRRKSHVIDLETWPVCICVALVGLIFHLSRLYWFLFFVVWMLSKELRASMIMPG